jgi:Fic family protein
MAIRNDGNWEGWLKFFLRGVAEVSSAATDMSREILNLREDSIQRIVKNLTSKSANALRLLDYLYLQPIITTKIVEKTLGCTFQTAGKLIGDLVGLGLLEETTGGKRNRVYRYKPYLEIFSRPLLRNASRFPSIEIADRAGDIANDS